MARHIIQCQRPNLRDAERWASRHAERKGVRGAHVEAVDPGREWRTPLKMSVEWSVVEIQPGHFELNVNWDAATLDDAEGSRDG